MKLSLKILALAPLLIGSLIQGYAILRAKEDQVPWVPFVDIYYWQVKTPQEALAKQKQLAERLKLPAATINILDKAVGISAPVAQALGPATEGVSVIVHKAVGIGVGVAKGVYPFVSKGIDDLIARWTRGEDHAHHWDIFPGNAGRDAEWKNNKPGYVIVTLPHSLIPLNEPHFVPAGGIGAFILTSEPNPEEPGKVIIRAKFDSKYNNQYIPAEKDKRNIKQLENEAKAKAEKITKSKI